MNEFLPSHEQQEDLIRAEITGLCFETLVHVLPKWFTTAKNYQNALMTTRDELLDDNKTSGINPRVDSTYISHDYKFEGIKSHRLRLVPQSLKSPNLMCDGKRVNEVIVNIPDAFIPNIDEMNNFQLALLTTVAVTDDNKRETQSYVITASDITKYNDFNDLDFSFMLFDQTQQKRPDVKNIWDVEPIFEEESNESSTQDYISLSAKRHLAKQIYQLLTEYRLGNQSRNDGTM